MQVFIACEKTADTYNTKETTKIGIAVVHDKRFHTEGVKLMFIHRIQANTTNTPSYIAGTIKRITHKSPTHVTVCMRDN